MKKRLMLVVFVLFTLAPNEASATTADDEARFVTLVNGLRTGRGLEPLEVHTQLVRPSREWAANMASSGTLAHASDVSVGVDAYWTKLGENVGVAPQDQVKQLFDAFVASPAHYRNLIDPQFRFIGVGVVYDQQGRIWTTHRFMAVDEPATTTPSSAMPPAIAAQARAPGAPTTTTVPAGDAATSPESSTMTPAQPAFVDPGPLSPARLAAVLTSLDQSGI